MKNSALGALGVLLLAQLPWMASARADGASSNRLLREAADSFRTLPSDSFPNLVEVMGTASTGYASVRAQQKQIEATENNKIATALNSISVTGSFGKTSENDSVNNSLAGATNFNPVTAQGYQDTVGVRLLLSLTTWFQVQGLELTQETQEAALKALRMQLATQAAQDYVNLSASDFKAKYLGFYLSELTGYKARALGGRTSSDTAAANLDNRIVSLQKSIRDASLQKDLAAADLKQFVGDQRLNQLESFISTVNARYTGQVLSDGKSSGIGWNAVDSFFPVPATSESAFGRASSSPALIQADLSEKQAQNTWYLTLASLGPFVSFNFNRNDSQNNIDVEGTKTDAVKVDHGYTFSASVGFSIGAGAYNSLRADTLLEEASEDNKEATEEQIQASLDKAYATLSAARSEMRLNEQIIQRSTSAFIRSSATADPKALRSYSQLFSSLDTATEELSRDYVTLLMTRIQIHGMMGTLLDEMATMGGSGGTAMPTVAATGKSRPDGL